MAFLCRQSVVRGNGLVVSTSTVTGRTLVKQNPGSVSLVVAIAAEVEAVAGRIGLFVGMAVADGDV